MPLRLPPGTGNPSRESSSVTLRNAAPSLFAREACLAGPMYADRGVRGRALRIDATVRLAPTRAACTASCRALHDANAPEAIGLSTCASWSPVMCHRLPLFHQGLSLERECARRHEAPPRPTQLMHANHQKWRTAVSVPETGDAVTLLSPFHAPFRSPFRRTRLIPASGPGTSIRSAISGIRRRRG